MLLFGVIGTAILLGLGIWQVQRLEWKGEIIGRLEKRLQAAPVALPSTPDPIRDDFLRIAAEGRLGKEAAYLLTSQRGLGPGYRVIAPLETEQGRRVLVDLGFIPQPARDEVPLGEDQVRIVGSLYWPEEVDGFTPEPDPDSDLWFARDLAAMSEALGTEPLLVVAEEHDLGRWPMPLRLGVNLPNNHLGYAITWFSLAVIWAVMSVMLAWGERRRRVLF